MPANESDLTRCPIFHGMSPEERRQILELVEYESYPQGETIIREGNATQILWVILRGSCEVVRTMKNGSQQQFAVLEPGAVFGEMSFFSPAPHSASVRTLSKVDVLRLPRDKYDALRHSGPDAADRIAMNTLSVLSERLRRMDDWTCQLVDDSGDASRRDEWRDFRRKLYSDWKF